MYLKSMNFLIFLFVIMALALQITDSTHLLAYDHKFKWCDLKEYINVRFLVYWCKQWIHKDKQLNNMIDIYLRDIQTHLTTWNPERNDLTLLFRAAMNCPISFTRKPHPVMGRVATWPLTLAKTAGNHSLGEWFLTLHTYLCSLDSRPVRTAWIRG